MLHNVHNSRGKEWVNLLLGPKKELLCSGRFSRQQLYLGLNYTHRYNKYFQDTDKVTFNMFATWIEKNHQVGHSNIYLYTTPLSLTILHLFPSLPHY